MLMAQKERDDYTIATQNAVVEGERDPTHTKTTKTTTTTTTPKNMKSLPSNHRNHYPEC